LNRKQFRFWTTDQEIELQEWLDTFDNLSNGIKEIIEKFRTGKLIDSTEIDLIKKKLLADIRLKELSGDLKEKELQYYEIFHSVPSSKAKTAMKVGIENQIADTPSCFDEKMKRIMCPECGSCFVFAEDQHDIPEAKELFIDHYIQKHSLKFPPQLQLELKSF